MTREWIINEGYRIICFLPVSISDFNIDQDDSVGHVVNAYFQVLRLNYDFLLTSTSEGRYQNMWVLDKVLKLSLYALEDVSVIAFLAQYHRSGVWNRFPLVVSYFC